MKNLISKYFLQEDVKLIKINSIKSLIISTIVSLLSLYLTSSRHEKYEDIIVGNITWTDQVKSMDYYVVFTFLMSYLLTWILFNYLSNSKRVLKKNSYLDDRQFSNPQIYILMSLIIIIMCMWIIRGYVPVTETIITLILVFMYLLLVNKSTEQGTFDPIIKVAMASFLLYFSLIAFMQVYNLFDHVSNIKKLQVVTQYPPLLFLLLGSILVIKYHNIFIKRLPNIILLLQIPLPLLYFCIIGLTFQQGEYVLKPSIPNGILIATIVTALVLMILNVIHFIKNMNKGDTSLNQLLSITSVMAIASFFAFRSPNYTPLTDDFHLGEIYIPWQQIITFKMNMFSDFVSVQGIMGIIYGGINKVLFGGSISYIGVTFNLWTVITVALTAIILCKNVNNIWALVISIISLPLQSNRFYLLLPIVIVLCTPKLIKNKGLWLFAWVWLSMFHCFYNPTVGAAQTLATIPIALLIFYGMVKSGSLKRAFVKHKVSLTIILMLNIGMIAWLIPSMLNLIEFLLDNSVSNTVAYGIPFFSDHTLPPWFPTWFPTKILNKFFWESIRIGGFIVCIGILWTIFINVLSSDKYNEDNKYEKQSLLYFCFVFILFIFAILPYALGRIDPGTFSRPGTLSLLALGSVIPISLTKLQSNKQKYLGTFIILFGLGIHYGFYYQPIDKMYLRGIQSVPVPKEAVLVDGNDLGLPNLGKMYVDPNKLIELRSSNKAFNFLLEDNETYFDLTNRSLYFYILNKPVPGLYSADYLAANDKIQDKVIKHLSEGEIPPVVWLSPSIRHDGGPASLRSYRIYKYFMDLGYMYYMQDGLEFMVSSEKVHELGLEKLSKKENDEKLAKIFGVHDLNKIPASWGRSLPNMDFRFNSSNVEVTISEMNDIKKINDTWYQITGNDPFIVFNLQKAIQGKENDFLALSINTKDSKEKSGQFFWGIEDNHFEENSSLRFNFNNGHLLLPLGSNPLWYNSTISKVRIDLDHYNDQFEITDFQFKKLVK